MAAVKFQKGSEEWQLFMDYWNLCQKYWQTEDTDEYWDELIHEMTLFAEKYDKCAFAVNLALAFIETQDTNYKKHNE